MPNHEADDTLHRMRELRFEDVNPDGTGLVFVDDETSETFEVVVDKRLLSSIALARVQVPAPNPTAQAMADPSEVGPAEIQMRLRMGHSPEEIAEQTGTDLARVLRYQDPIVNERAWVAERAAAVKLRKGNEQVALGEVVTSRLNAISEQDVDVQWDAWRREDGLWLVRVSYETTNGQREAHWLFDAAISSIAPHDAEAEWLMELDPPEMSKASPPRRLVSVPPPTSTESAELNGVDDDGFFDVDAVVERKTDDSGADEGPSPLEDVGLSDAGLEDVGLDDAGLDEADAGINEVDVGVVEEDASERGRPSIPSWDEILFGTPTRPRD